jgi:hypothetical protein
MYKYVTWFFRLAVRLVLVSVFVVFAGIVIALIVHEVEKFGLLPNATY